MSFYCWRGPRTRSVSRVTSEVCGARDSMGADSPDGAAVSGGKDTLDDFTEENLVQHLARRPGGYGSFTEG